MQAFATETLKHCGGKVQIFREYCPNCYKSDAFLIVHPKPDDKGTYERGWTELMDAGFVDPYQVLTTCEPSRASSRYQFVHPILSLSKPGHLCKNNAKCDPRCIICWGILDPEIHDIVSPEPWPHLRVHLACCAKCTFPNCQAILPSVSARLPGRPAPACSLHSRRSVVAPLRPQPPAPDPPALSLPPMITSSSRSAPPPVKTTLKKPSAARAKLDKINARTKSPSVAAFFAPPTQATPTQSSPTPAKAEPPRRLLLDTKTGEPYGYWVGSVAYDIRTNEPLFQSCQPVRTKFDFTPPSVPHLQLASHRPPEEQH